MKLIPKLRKHNYLTRIGIFLIATALIVGTVSCAGDGNGNGNGNGEVGKLDHFKGYYAHNLTEWLPMGGVYLEDQFGAFNATILGVWYFYNPAEKQHGGDVTPVLNTTHHFTVYAINYTEMPQERQVTVNNQFGLQNLTVWGPAALAVPTQKQGHAAPVGLDHYLLYEVILGTYPGVAINLTDQFGSDPYAWVSPSYYFANPVKKIYKGDVTNIVNPDVHGVIYGISGYWNGTQISVNNQFGNQTINVTNPSGMFVPSAKVVPPPLDHFKCYNVMNASSVMGDVYVEDQFILGVGYWPLAVHEAVWFCNPVDKNGEGMTNPDNHLTVYNITILTGLPPTTCNVTVNNQFGVQNMTVYGPVALAAPTWKLVPNSHGLPKYLDHYLLYEVVAGSAVNITVNLDDEFEFEALGVNVTMPRYFANPVLYKEHLGVGNVTGAWDPEAHLVFYDISDNTESLPWVWVLNQFEYGVLNLTPFEQLLAVPSDKFYYGCP